MTIRDELETIGFELAASGVAFGGSIAALFTLPIAGLYSGAPLVATAVYMGLVPMAVVGIVALFLRKAGTVDLHPVVVATAAFAGGTLGAMLFYPLGFIGLEFLAALLVFAAAEVARLAWDQPELTASEAAAHGLVALGLYGIFAASPLAIAMRWITIAGCEECDPVANGITAALLLVLAAIVGFVAALRHRPLWDRSRGPAHPGDMLR